MEPNEHKLGFERLYVGVSCAGLGEKRARGYGLGFQRLSDGAIEVSIGRKGGGYYGSPTKVSAWARLTPIQAHEMACAIMHLINKEFPCEGEGVKEVEKHQANLRMNLDFTVDLCSIMHNPTAVKAEILKRVEAKLNEIKLPSEETKASGSS